MHDLDQSGIGFRRLVESVPAITYVRTVGSPSLPVYVSPQVEEYLGFPSAAWIEDPDLWARRVHPDDVDRVMTALADHQATGQPLDCEYRMVARDGTIRWLHDTARLVSDGPGESAYSQGVAADVSRAKEAEAALRGQKATLDAIVAASPVVIVSVDAHGRNRFVSPAALGTTGRAPAELVGGSALRYFHPADVDEVRAGFDAMVAGAAEQYRGLVRYRHADGRWLTVDCRGEVVRDGAAQTMTVVYSMTEVTERSRLMQQLRAAMEAAELANRAKSSFLSRMSHELRTPLNAVLGFAQLLEMSELGEDDVDSVVQIRGAGEHLLSLIDEVLEISRIEAGELSISLEPVLLHDVVTEVVDLLGPQASTDSIDVTVLGDLEEQDVVAADRQRLKQVLLNLVGNAIKYNDAGGAVTVSWRGSVDGLVRLSVADTGWGIDPDALDRVFDPFDRLGAETTAVPGTGLGLALSQRLVQVMGGTLEVASTHGEGSTFSIELSRAQRSAGSSASAPVSIHDVSVPPLLSGRVLYIEDNPANVRLVERLLVRAGVEVVTANTGEEGIRFAVEDPPDVVLLDLNLPDLDGQEVLARLRRQPATSGVPVLVLTADATSRRREELLAMGVHAHLVKPLNVSALYTALVPLLGVEPSGRAGGAEAP